jgi:hypothetical protein
LWFCFLTLWFWNSNLNGKNYFSRQSFFKKVPKNDVLKWIFETRNFFFKTLFMHLRPRYNSFRKKICLRNLSGIPNTGSSGRRQNYLADNWYQNEYYHEAILKNDRVIFVIRHCTRSKPTKTLRFRNMLISFCFVLFWT